jgi:hypothetical protein
MLVSTPNTASSSSPSTSSEETKVGEESNDRDTVAVESAVQGGETIDEFVNAPPIAKRHLRLRDFNLYAIRNVLDEPEKFMELNNQDGNMRRIVTEPSTLSGQGVLDDVESWLPYIEIVSKETFEITDVMLDEARILLMTVCCFILYALFSCL